MMASSSLPRLLFVCSLTRLASAAAAARSSPGAFVPTIPAALQPPFSRSLCRRSQVLRGGADGAAGIAMGAVQGEAEDFMVQYIVVRRDLQSELGWPLGSLMAQGCHAVAKVLWEMREDDNVKAYCGNIDNMRKVVLGVRDEKELAKAAKRLEDNGIEHRLWLEQPENIPTALATKPYLRSVVAPHLKKLSLLK